MIVKLNIFKRIIIRVFGKRMVSEEFYGPGSSIKHVGYLYKGIIYILKENIKYE